MTEYGENQKRDSKHGLGHIPQLKTCFAQGHADPLAAVYRSPLRPALNTLAGLVGLAAVLHALQSILRKVGPHEGWTWDYIYIKSIYIYMYICHPYIDMQSWLYIMASSKVLEDSCPSGLPGIWT